MKIRTALIFSQVIFYMFVLMIEGQTWNAAAAPGSVAASAFGSWIVDITTGHDTISTGGSIKVQFPSGWVNSPWPESKLKAFQFDNPGQNHYLGFEISNKNCNAKLEVVRQGIDNQFDRFNRSFVVTLIEGKLLPGDRLSFYFFNTTAPITSERQEIAIAFRKNREGEFIPIGRYPSIEILPAAPEKIRIITPSQALTGTEIEFKVVVTDHFYNSTKFYEGNIGFKIDESIVVSPSTYKFKPSDNGVKQFKVTFTKPGLHTLTVVDDFNLAPHGIKSNPVNVSDVPLLHNIYWGDLHSHSGNSKDGVGKTETAFTNAKDAAVLDFFALTDHGAGDSDSEGNYWVGLTDEEWEENKLLVNKFYEPGKFVTLLACEWSGSSPYGHHNIIYRDVSGEFFGEDIFRNVEAVWGLLNSKNALTIPHHTGIVWPGGSTSVTDWSLEKNDSLRTSIEIYSLWGSGEYYWNSMSYERYHQRNFSSHCGANYAQDAWALGHYVGAVAGSDEHTSHPGKDFGGLTAVLAKTLDRNSVFEAIKNRHTYATTGERILIDFRINNEIMGSKVFIDSEHQPKIALSVAGTDIIDSIELLKYNGKQWIVLFIAEPNSINYSSSFSDYDFRNQAIYYMRVKQKNIVGDREVRAWTSPIWVYVKEKNNK